MTFVRVIEDESTTRRGRIIIIIVTGRVAPGQGNKRSVFDWMKPYRKPCGRSELQSGCEYDSHLLKQPMSLDCILKMTHPIPMSEASEYDRSAWGKEEGSTYGMGCPWLLTFILSASSSSFFTSRHSFDFLQHGFWRAMASCAGPR
jgi:hypothetical protein